MQKSMYFSVVDNKLFGPVSCVWSLMYCQWRPTIEPIPSIHHHFLKIPTDYTISLFNHEWVIVLLLTPVMSVDATTSDRLHCDIVRILFLQESGKRPFFFSTRSSVCNITVRTCSVSVGLFPNSRSNLKLTTTSPRTPVLRINLPHNILSTTIIPGRLP